ncbi:MAG: hypothetical protein ACK4IU_05015 [Tabrizicola flagellatus]|uniref:hypothetical protein n=1 Tax=Tabrizicola flagellatus TaxID=2593021 RepID=UPI00391A4396
MRAVLLSLILAAPAQAQMLDGADDPAFRAALTNLLAKDDPAAVAALRDLAEAGNAAALVTLPLALTWVPPQGNLKEKNAQRQVAGIKAQDAAAAAHAAIALWNGGRVEDAMTLPDRAAGLLALGEPAKAALLLHAWVNQTGGKGDLPAEIFSDEIPAMIGAFALTGRLTSAVYHDGNPAEEAARLLTLMRENRAGRLGRLCPAAGNRTPDLPHHRQSPCRYRPVRRRYQGAHRQCPRRPGRLVRIRRPPPPPPPPPSRAKRWRHGPSFFP